jgi:hypothetical protein
MDIKDLNKSQMILLTLLICFVVSIATGIVTISLMQKMPQTVPQTINRIIERTIQNVSSTDNVGVDSNVAVTDSNALVNIYSDINTTGVDANNVPVKEPTPLGQGVLVSDVGLIMIDSTILNGFDVYTVKLNTQYFQAKILKKFSNGTTILKIVQKGKETKTDTKTDTNTTVDVKQ